MDAKYENEAKLFCEAIQTLAENDYALQNLYHYLSYHFEKWIKEYANSPIEIAAELKMFSEIKKI